MSILAPQSAIAERTAELSTLAALLDEARAGRGGLVLIEGPAGIGKTRLLAAACELGVGRGLAILRARAGELEQGFPFGIVRQLFERLVTSDDDDLRGGLLRGAAHLSEPVFTEADPPGAPAGDRSFATLHGLYWLTANLCERGAVLVAIDDLQWADAPSLRYLDFLARRLDELPLLVAAAVRLPEPEPPRRPLAEILDERRATRLRLPPLSPLGAARLLADGLGTEPDAPFTEACHRATGGNPFLLTALTSALAREGVEPTRVAVDRVSRLRPASVARELLTRLGRLPDAVALARAVAAAGEPLELTHAAAVAGLGSGQAAAAADALVGAGVFARERPLDFVHPIVRESLAAELYPGEVAAAHARLARLLAQASADPDRVATHLVAAEPAADPWAVGELRLAAARASARGAPDAAVAFLRRALAEPPDLDARAGTLLELGSAEIRIGAGEAAEHLQEALERGGEPRLVALAARELGLARAVGGDVPGAVRAMETAIAAAEAHDRELALNLEAHLAAHAALHPDTRDIAARRLAGRQRLSGATAGERHLLAAQAVHEARLARSAAVAGDLVERALGGERFVAERQTDLVGPSYLLVLALIAADRLDAADRLFEQALHNARGRGSALAFAFICAWRARLAHRRGAIGDAEADARTAHDLFAVHPWRLGRRFALAFLIEALTEQGRLDEADDLLLGDGMGGELPPGLGENFVLEARGRLRLAQGRRAEGLQDLAEFGRRDAACGAVSPLASRHRSAMAVGLVAAGRADEALALAAQDLRSARRWGTPRAVGVAQNALALARSGEEQLSGLQDAATTLAAAPAPLERAGALVDLGAALRRRNRRSEAREPLRQALELAHRAGAGALCERARTELLAAGARPRNVVLSGADALTPSERRVSEMAAAGLANPEIAQALFVTRKTVEKHLANAFRKLDIDSRAALGRALGPSAAPSGADASRKQ